MNSLARHMVYLWYLSMFESLVYLIHIEDGSCSTAPKCVYIAQNYSSVDLKKYSGTMTTSPIKVI